MTLSTIVELLDAEVLTGKDRLNEEVNIAFASDLMSDVLAFGSGCDFMITGLTNAQAIRTAEMLDIQYILFVREKKLTQDMLDLAEDGDVVVLNTNKTMFNSCGILYAEGLRGVI